MQKITKEELLHLAYISRLHLDDKEIPSLINQIQAVLEYAERVNEITESITQELAAKNINTLREDVVKKVDVEPILAQAPEREEDFFVVPVIIEK